MADLEVAHTAMTDILSGMVVAKGNREMLRIVADGLEVQSRDGTLVAVADRYGMAPGTIVPIETRQ